MNRDGIPTWLMDLAAPPARPARGDGVRRPVGDRHATESAVDRLVDAELDRIASGGKGRSRRGSR